MVHPGRALPDARDAWMGRPVRPTRPRAVMGVTMANPREEPPAFSELDESLRAALRFLAYECTDPGPVPEGPALLPRSETLHLEAAPLDSATAAMAHGLQECLESESTTPRLTVVLDLDETLSHCRLEPLESLRPDFCVQFEESKATGYVYVRPHARLFLEAAARLFEVVVFTASSKSYADQVLDQLDPGHQCISTRLYRPHCVERSGAFLKDLRRMGRRMDRCLLVDNSPVSLALCPDNAIVCSSWTAEDPLDEELLELLLLLQTCDLEVSVPKFLGRRYGLRALVELLRRRPDLLE
ncbi:CTDSPL2 [Symbiodinium sp. CCMP2592]|nr:CTDSPL2 [Symbiodinium sp. CCMP2592]